MLLRVFLFALCAAITKGSRIQSGLRGEPADKSTFRVDYQFYPQADGWLKLHQIPVPWHEAHHTCYLEGSVLASPITEGLTTVIRNLAQEAQLLTIHTGIHSLATPEDYYSSEGIHLRNIPVTWAEGEPNNLGNKERCLAMTSQGALADDDCETGTMRPYFCYKKKQGYSSMNECGYHDNQYEVDLNTGHCYKFHVQPMTWHQGLTVCTAEGGTLAVINSEAEAKFIENLALQHNHKTWVSLGFQKWLHGNGYWLTMEGTTPKEAGFDRWLKGQPDNYAGHESCGTFITGINNEPLQLNDITCTEKIAFVCEISKYTELTL